jgi:hypothetical protein
VKKHIEGKRPLKSEKSKACCVDADIESICSIDHCCTGCRGKAKYCCASYEICLSEEEVRGAMVWMAEAARYAPHLRSADGYINCFAECDDDLFSIDTKDDGLCVFAYLKNGRLLCSLHSVAMDHAIPLGQIKPLSCLLWPLSISEGRKRILSIQDDAFAFPCNRRTGKRQSTPSGPITDIIEMVFGERFAEEIKEAAGRGEKQLRVRLPEGFPFK